MKLNLLLIGFAINCFFISSQIYAYSGGTGEANDPYQISTVADWQTLSNDPCSWKKNFILTDDIDFGGADLTPVALDINSTGFYFQGVPFEGLFDGNGHVLRNTVINQPTTDYVGVFGYVDNNGQICNLGVEHIAVVGRFWVGGLVGMNYGSVRNCYSIGDVSGSWCTGGLSGLNYGDITKCYSIATVNNSDMYLGGLVGANEGNIVNCHSGGAVHGVDTVGGLIGRSDSGSIENCYSTTAIIGTGIYTAGGLIAWNISPSQIINCFWNVETSGLTVSAQGRGLSTAMMKDMKTYSLNGWAGSGWTINDGYDYPHFDWENIPGQQIAEQTITLEGGGTQECPYKIKSAEDLQLLGLASILWDKWFILANDIDSQGYDIEPIGYDSQTAFSGVFDGNGHVISNLTIDAAGFNYIGLFGCTKANGVIKNLGIEDVNIVGKSYVGGLVGCDNYGNIANCYVTGTVRGNSYVGGLAGQCQYDSVSDCHSVAVVTGGDNIGGLVGYISRSNALTNCYSTGAVSGNRYVGGIAGQLYYGVNTIIVKNCYNTGTVSGNSLAGGLVGSSGGSSIIECSNIGAISGNDSIGGLVGSHWGNIIKSYNTGAIFGVFHTGGLIGYGSGNMTDCYNNGDVNGNNYVGGLTGKDAGTTLTNCYNNGMVNGGRYIGGLVGGKRGITVKCVNSFWDVNSSGITHGIGDMQSDPPGATGLTTEGMKNSASFTSWDFVGEEANGTNDIWYMHSCTGYPRLTWQNHRAIANAGVDQTGYAGIGSTATMTLNGSGSNDVDGDALIYKWTCALGANVSQANGVNPAIELPVGVHTIQLVVNDGVVNSEPDEVVITVMGPVEGLQQLKENLAAMNLDKSVLNSLSAKVNTALQKLEDGDQSNDIAAVNGLQAFINAVNAQKGKKITQENTEYLVEAAEVIIGLVE